jgi:hypothetical protein
MSEDLYYNTKAGERTIAKILNIAAQDIGIGAAHHHMGELDEAIWRIETAINLLKNARVVVFMEIEEKERR